MQSNVLTAFLAGQSSELALCLPVELILVKTCVNLVRHARSRTTIGTDSWQAGISKPSRYSFHTSPCSVEIDSKASTLKGVSVRNATLGSGQLSPGTVWQGRFHPIS